MDVSLTPVNNNLKEEITVQKQQYQYQKIISKLLQAILEKTIIKGE